MPEYQRCHMLLVAMASINAPTRQPSPRIFNLIKFFIYVCLCHTLSLYVLFAFEHFVHFVLFRNIEIGEMPTRHAKNEAMDINGTFTHFIRVKRACFDGVKIAHIELTKT